MKDSSLNNLIDFIRDYYDGKKSIHLHEPVFTNKNIILINSAIESTFVSSIGQYVNQFELELARYTGSYSAITTVNGTSALHASLHLAGVSNNDLVITQSLTFIATANAISYCGAKPIFIDIDKDTMGMSPKSLEEWLEENAFLEGKTCKHKDTLKTIKACVPMHTYGHPVKIDKILDICKKWKIVLIEDAAESLGSLYKDRHTGTFGELAALSFNGNKIITTGGGGAILSSKKYAAKAKHITTTSKIPDKLKFNHDEIGFNYRLPNLNAAMGCAQISSLESILRLKRKLAYRYMDVLKDTNLSFVKEPKNSKSNYWLNTVLAENISHRDSILKITNEVNIFTRPAWGLMHKQKMYKSCIKGNLENTLYLSERIINIPSGIDIKDLNLEEGQKNDG